jgi:hypothetical protein
MPAAAPAPCRPAPACWQTAPGPSTWPPAAPAPRRAAQPCRGRSPGPQTRCCRPWPGTWWLSAVCVCVWRGHGRRHKHTSIHVMRRCGQTAQHRTPHTAHRTPHTAHHTPHTAHSTPLATAHSARPAAPQQLAHAGRLHLAVAGAAARGVNQLALARRDHESSLAEEDLVDGIIARIQKRLHVLHAAGGCWCLLLMRGSMVLLHGGKQRRLPGLAASTGAGAGRGWRVRSLLLLRQRLTGGGGGSGSVHRSGATVGAQRPPAGCWPGYPAATCAACAAGIAGLAHGSQAACRCVAPTRTHTRDGGGWDRKCHSSIRGTHCAMLL